MTDRKPLDAEELRQLRLAVKEIDEDADNFYGRRPADWANDVARLLATIDALEKERDEAREIARMRLAGSAEEAVTKLRGLVIDLHEALTEHEECDGKCEWLLTFAEVNHSLSRDHKD